MVAKVEERLRATALAHKVMSAEEAARIITDGMTLGLSGFTRAGDAKAIPMALVDRANAGEKFKVNVFTGASLGSDIDALMSDAGIVNKRLPFQLDRTMRSHINKQDMYFVDQHLSVTAEYLRQNAIDAIDVAVVEAVAITEDGMLIPTTSVGNSPIYVQTAKKVIIELNLASYEQLEGIHDIYVPEAQGERGPIPLVNASDRIGTIGIPLDFDKVAAIVLTDQVDTPTTMTAIDDETQQIADHIIDFFRKEVKEGRLTETLAPLQSGVGSVANAVLGGMANSEF
ncbi:MAG: acetyl-CoA hydrolase, partial [Kurthia sp.]|nr:acetyl-CoA hydrolase [Kurthia sp.]